LNLKSKEMKRKSNILISILLTLLFIFCLFLPVVHFVFGKDLIGAEAFVFNFVRLFMVQDFVEYLKVVSTVLSNFFVLVLLIWSFRERLKFIPTLIISILALTTASTWIFKYSDKGVLMFGYWFWLFFIVLLVGFNFYKIKSQKLSIA